MEPTLEETTQDHRPRFSLKTLLWVVTLLGMGMGTYGPLLGMYLALLAMYCIHLMIEYRKKYRLLIPFVLVLVLGFHLLIALLLPAAASARDAALRSYSMSNIKQLCLAMQNYHDVEGHFPRPYSLDLNKHPLHGWRALLLPFLERNSPYKKLDLTKPWNEEENMEASRVFEHGLLFSPRYPERKEAIGVANYLAIVDEETVWHPSDEIKFSDITEGTSKTIVMIEVLGKDIPWYEPRDLSLEEAIDILMGNVDGEYVRPGFFVSERLKGDGLNDRAVGFADGHVQTLYRLKDRAIARALLTRSGGETLPDDWENYTSREDLVLGYVVHWGRIGSTLLFVALAILPLWQQKSRRADNG